MYDNKITHFNYFYFSLSFFFLLIVRTKDDEGVPCDMVIADGTCIVNEAMLSGESTPLLKVIIIKNK